MKKQMKRTVYEAPVTERFSVELEGGFMSASVMENDHTVNTSGQQVVDVDESVVEEWNKAQWQ